MLDFDRHAQQERPSSFARWVYQALGQAGIGLRVRQRGNHLHVLCESRQRLDTKAVVNRLVDALQVQAGELPFPDDPENPIHQIVIYSRRLGQQQPDWIRQIRLKTPSQGTSPASEVWSQTPPDADNALLVSNESLARSGSPEAIARYLSEVLEPLNVGVKVQVQTLPKAGRRKSPQRRLWVICHSNYSPDASLLVEPAIEQLRRLQLKGFRDAAICSQVSGEEAPEWMLRVDLTPPEVMLRDWARWGDVQAIARLLNRALAAKGLSVQTTVKEATLHLVCRVADSEAAAIPDKAVARGAIAAVLRPLTPQGIHGATLYGVESPPSQSSPLPAEETPAWIEWLDLPTQENPTLEASTYALARQGNLEALTFLLQRLLNPDLDRRLANGGIQVKIRRKADLLHVMSEAPICPLKARVCPPIKGLLRQLAVPDIAGVRIYGRRAGATSPSWHYGVNFVQRRRFIPEATPEFAASDAYVQDLVNPAGESGLRPELTERDLRNGLQQTVQGTVGAVRRWLCHSQLFVPAAAERELALVPQDSIPQSEGFWSSQGLKVALVWGAVGLLLTVQVDWLVGRLLRSPGSAPTPSLNDTPPTPLALPQLSLQQSAPQSAENFEPSGFTREGQTQVVIEQQGNRALDPEEASVATAATLATVRSPNPSFNNPLLDEKLALYQQRLLRSGPPDVLIVGSSRAMRGVDPLALREALAAQGYSDVEVFNFGINGATAQVVDLLLSRILTPEQLPKLIIWADGARAFNSGSEDATYEAIANSEAYQKLQAGNFPRSTEENSGEPSPEEVSWFAAFRQSHQSLNDWLNQALSSISSTYPERDRLKSLLRERFADLLENAQLDGTRSPAADLPAEEVSMDFDGFLPITERFHPATYYDDHPRVRGEYDGDYQSFQLSGKQDEALDALLQYTQTRDIDLVFVNLPLTQDYLDPVRSQYEEQFQRYMHAQALEKGLIFRDLSELLLAKPDYFSDPSHLNRYGAYQVSKHLANDPMIPWPAP